MSQIVDENGKKRFDTRVTITDPKTGQVSKQQPYQYHCSRGKSPEQWYVRDGIRYHTNGDLIDKPTAKPAVPSAEKSEKAPVQSDVEKGLL